MTQLVPEENIEEIVGRKRHPTDHYGCAQPHKAFYILHSKACKDSGIDLRECEFSLALDRGLYHRDWPLGVAVRLLIFVGRLEPSEPE